MTPADYLAALRAHADQTREGLKEVAAIVTFYYSALIGAGSPPALAFALARDWHRATFLVPRPDEKEEADGA